MNAKQAGSSALILLQLAASGAFAQDNKSRDAVAHAKATELRNVLDVATILAPQCFTSGGSFDNFLKICVSERGTISHFESPQGHVHINGREGYVACADNNPKVAVGFDAFVAEAGWGAPSVSQPNGAGTFPMIISRSSVDGRLQLKQTFTANAAELGMDIKMDVKNISAALVRGVQVDRYFDGDIDGTASNDSWRVSSERSVWGFRNLESMLALSIKGLAPALPHAGFGPAAEFFSEWNPTGTFQAARTCSPFNHPGFDLRDGVGRMQAFLGDINPGQTKSVTFRYRRF
jgi:hypothetical protein